MEGLSLGFTKHRVDGGGKSGPRSSSDEYMIIIMREPVEMHSPHC